MSSARYESLKILIPLLVALLLAAFLPSPFSGILSLLLFLAVLFSLYFFRDPERYRLDDDPSLLLSAADGLVTDIETVENAPFNLGPMKRVSVFLSVFDVHVNRIPFDGNILEISHTPGKFLDARAANCAVENERMDWRLQTLRGPLVVRQIAGLIARRIVAWAGTDQFMKAGERIGMIRFGSRTDVFLPLSCEILVDIGQHVQGGLTPLARWTTPPSASSFADFLPKS